MEGVVGRLGFPLVETLSQWLLLFVFGIFLLLLVLLLLLLLLV